ncbi:MAG: hypothetical protein H6696_01815 [Deferribacteres bacterium]|nr:hypothetical protein [candidate division KSB1 bacterium]MCB9500648.1 hypothetical protein [Deferribacteres bacterium]
MATAFKTLFEVVIFHDYYKKGFSQDFFISPDEHTKIILQDLGLLFRQTAKGCVVLFSALSIDNTPLRRLEDKEKLTFILRARNPCLHNYTDLPVEQNSNAIYLLRNSTENSQDGELLLTAKKDTNLLTEEDRIELKPQAFSVDHSANTNSVLFELMDEAGQLVERKSQRVAEGKARHSFLLPARKSGLYKLSIDGTQRQAFYYNPSLRGVKAFGLIEISLGEAIPPAYQFINPDGTVSPKTYVVHLRRRETFWRYKVSLKHNVDTPAALFDVIHPDDTISFNRDVPVSEPGQSTVMPFTSIHPLPLQEAILKGISLVKKDEQGHVVRELLELPNPSIALLTHDKTTNKTYSDIFIQI